jgi:hypothetical protein
LRAADQETPRYLVQLLDATRKQVPPVDHTSHDNSIAETYQTLPQLSVKPENLTLVENDDEEEKHASKGARVNLALAGVGRTRHCKHA